MKNEFFIGVYVDREGIISDCIIENDIEELKKQLNDLLNEEGGHEARIFDNNNILIWTSYDDE
jgi:hypothetical protein